MAGKTTVYCTNVTSAFDDKSFDLNGKKFILQLPWFPSANFYGIRNNIFFYYNKKQVILKVSDVMLKLLHLLLYDPPGGMYPCVGGVLM